MKLDIPDDIAYDVLVRVEAVNPRRDGRRDRSETIEVVTLTRAGRDLARQASRENKGCVRSAC